MHYENNRIQKINHKKMESDKLQSTMTFQPHINGKSVCKESVFRTGKFIDKLVSKKKDNFEKIKNEVFSLIWPHAI